jgi:excisionase family DNA binding protein
VNSLSDTAPVFALNGARFHTVREPLFRFPLAPPAPPTAADDDVLTLAEAAEVARVSTRTLYRAARSGEGPFYKVGAQWRVDASALRDWMRGRDQDAAAKPGKGVLAEVEAIREGSK